VERRKEVRKGFGLPIERGGDWDVRRLDGAARSNGHAGAVAKSGASIAEALGYVLTPRLAGGDEIREPYLESWVVHSCLRVISEAIEQVGIQIWDGPGESARILPDSNPVVKLFARPNPWTSWSQHASMGAIHRNLSGEDFWFLCDVAGHPIIPDTPAAYDPMVKIDLPVAIHSVNGTYVSDNRGPDGRVQTWQYGTTRGLSEKYPAGSVLHFRNYDPTDPCRGIGPAEVALRQLSIAFQAERYGEATLRAGGPGAFICYPQEMSAETQQTFQEEVDTSMSDPRAVGKVKILTGNPTVVPVPQSPKDMLSIDQLKWSRDVVASLFGVPLPIIGVLENATYSNMKEAWRQFWLKISSYLKTVEDVINSSFFPRLKNAQFANYRFAFDLSNVAALKSDDADLIRLAGELVGRGFGISLNEALALVGSQAEEVPSGDQNLFLAQYQTGPSAPRSDPPSSQKLYEMLLEELRHGTPDPQA
jgi:HK97 family phage portal protein